MTDTSLTTTAAPVAVLDGMEDLRQEDFLTPRWSVIQPSSRKDMTGTHSGQFYRNVDNAFRPELECVILKSSPDNTLWPDLGAKQPECQSHDGIRGTVHGECGKCLYNRFANRELDQALRAGGKDKHCNVGGFTLVLATLPDEVLSFMGVTSKSIRSIKLLQTTFRMHNAPFYGARVIFRTELEVNQQGKFYVLRPEPVEWYARDSDEYRKWAAFYAQVKGLTLVDIVAEPEPADEAAIAF